MQALMQRGDFIDSRFEIEAEAGAGGMGMVYRARDRATGALVAIKLLHNADASHTARFMREIHALASVAHAHVVQYVTHGVTEAGEPYLVMEWLEGESLEDRLAHEKLGLAEALALARHVAEALGAAHARGIVHRDIKPSNLFLVHGDVARVKVLDFGIAQLTDDTLTLTLTNQVIGTAGYMAPEQARGELGRVDARSDVFSLGCVLFECLTGRPAFEGAHLMALLAKLLLDESPRVRSLAPDVPEAIDALVARMMDRSPAMRPANGTAVAQALAALAACTDAANEEQPAASSSRVERRQVSMAAATLCGSTPASVATTMVPAEACFLLQGEAENEAVSSILLGEPSELVGRERELGHLADRVEEGFAEEQPAALLATAATDMGKSRLARETMHVLAARHDDRLLAVDFDQGREHARAASFHHRAAMQALRGHDLAAVMGHVQRGLALESDAQTRGGLHAIHAAACFWRADHAASHESARQALDLAAPGTQAHWLALSMAIFSAGYTGQHEALASLIGSLLDAEPGPEASANTNVALDRFMLDAFWGAFVALITSGRVTEAEMCLRRLERIVNPRREREPLAAACLEMAYTYWHRYVARAPWNALGHGRTTLTLYALAGEPGARDLQQALMVACELMELGAFAEAEQIVAQWPPAGESQRFAGLWSTYARTMVYAQVDRLDEAIALATATEVQASAQGDHVLAVRLRYVMIDCLLQHGDVAEAEQQLLALGEYHAMQLVDRPELLATQARIRLQQGRHREAVQLAGEALAADDTVRIGVYAIRDVARLVRAEALHALGDVAAAETIREARDDLVARAARIEDPTYRRSFLHDVPLHARVLGLARDWLGHDPTCAGAAGCGVTPQT